MSEFDRLRYELVIISLRARLKCALGAAEIFRALYLWARGIGR